MPKKKSFVFFFTKLQNVEVPLARGFGARLGGGLGAAFEGELQTLEPAATRGSGARSPVVAVHTLQLKEAAFEKQVITFSRF